MITAITPERIWYLLRALVPYDGRFSVGGALAVRDEIDGWFGFALATGVVTAVVIVTRLVHIASQSRPTLLFGFFFGLIAVSALILLREIRVVTAFQKGAGIVGFVVAFLLSGSATFLTNGGLFIVFVSGAIAVSAMILPGTSGSLMLVILGQYTRMSATLSRFIDGVAGVVAGEPSNELASHGSVVATFVLGGVLGLFTVSRVVRRALDRNRRATMAFLVALVVGALRAPVERVQTEAGFSTEVLVGFGGAAGRRSRPTVARLIAVDLDLETLETSR